MSNFQIIIGTSLLLQWLAFFGILYFFGGPHGKTPT